MSAQLRDAIAVLRALRAEPQTPAEIAKTTGVHWRKVYRLIDQLIDAGAPIKQANGPRPKHGMVPSTYSLSVAALREWLG